MANTVDITLQLKKQGNAIDKIEKDLKDLNKTLKTTEKDADKAGDSIQDIGKNGSKNIDGLGTSFNGLGTAVAGATLALGAFLTSVALSNKELKQLATLSGLSIEEFQKFALAAELAGVNADQTADALNNLSLKINEAVILGGGAASDVFRKLGLSLEEIQKLSPEKQFEELAKALQGVDAQQRKLFLDELASDALIQLTPLINEYEKFTGLANEFANSGGIITQDDIDKTEGLTQSFTLLTQQLQVSGTKALGVFSDELAPVILELTGYINELTQDTEEGFSRISLEAARLSSIIKVTISAIRILINGIQVWGEILKETFRNAAEGFQAILDANFSDFEWDFNMDGLNQQIADIQDSFDGLEIEVLGITDPEIKLIDSGIKDLKNSVKSFNDELAGIERTKAVTKLEDDIESLKTNLEASAGEIGETLYNFFLKQIEDLENALPSKFSFGISDEPVVVEPVLSVDTLEKQYEEAIRQIGIAKLELELGVISEDEFIKTFNELGAQAQFALNSLINFEGLDSKTIDDYQLKLLQVVKDYDTLTKLASKSKQELDAFNKQLLQGEIEILKAQGQEEQVLKLQSEEKKKQIQDNEKLNEQQKQLLLNQQQQLQDVINANTQISELQNQIAELNVSDENGFINEEDFTALDELIAKIKELEVAYGLSAEASVEASQIRQEAINEQKDAEKELVNEFSQGLADMLIDSVNTTDSIADVFTRMINQILEELIRAELTSYFNDLFSGLGGALGGGGSLFSGFSSFFHTGGVVGQDGFKKPLATKYHTGGIAGLAPDEVPAVLQKGEEVLTANDPRHRNNGGANNAQQVQINNLLDSTEIAQSLDGNQSFGNAIMNYITANKNEVNNTLNN